MAYVDGFLLAVPARKLAAYRRISAKAGRVWKEYGALEYRECIGDDLAQKGAATFQKRVKAKKGEVVVFSWIVYRNRRDRDRINKKVMADPRLAAMADPKNLPFDAMRMFWGGFKPMVEYAAG